MPLYRNSQMTMYFPEETVSERWPCDVRIDEGIIVVSYSSPEGHVVYKGTELQPGHFKLTSTENATGSATLHRFEGAETLEGSWYEDREFGMWQIDLSDLER